MAQYQHQIESMDKLSKLSMVAKVRTAFSRRHALATLIGIVKGGAIPFGTFALYHLEMHEDFWQPKAIVVLGGLLYSARTVYGWCLQAFRKEGGPDRLKAIGWCVGIEGFMTVSSTFWLNCAALGLLVLVNAVATGVSLAMEDEAMRAAQAAEEAQAVQADEAVDVPHQDAQIAEIRAELATLRAAQAATPAAPPPAADPTPEAPEAAIAPPLVSTPTSSGAKSRKRSATRRGKSTTRAIKDSAIVN